MTRTDKSFEDTLLKVGGVGLAGMLLAGSAVWLAAQAVLLVTEQRLLIDQSGTMLDVSRALLGHPEHPSGAFAAADRAFLPAGMWLYGIAAPFLCIALAGAEHACQLVSSRVSRRTSKDSRWARPSDLSSLRVLRADQGRLVLGHSFRRLIATEHLHSVAVFGPAGSGKTCALVVPALLEHPGPAIAFSAKTDPFKNTVARRASLGPTYCYDPMGMTGLVCVGWTPLRACLDWVGAKRMAEALTSAVGETGLSESFFWDSSATKLLEPLLHAAALDNRTMREVVRWVDTREQIEIANILENHKAHDALQSWIATMTHDDRTLANIYASTDVILRAYSMPGIHDVRISQSFDLDELLARNGTLYVCAPTEDQTLLQPIFTTLFKDIYRAAVHRAKHLGPLDPSLLIVLDDAANIGPIRELAEIASTCRSHGIQLITVFQDLAQVQVRYPTMARTIVNNHAAKLLLPGADQQHLDLLTNILDDSVEEIRSISLHGTRRSQSMGCRPLAATHQLRQLPKGSALLLYRNFPPIKLTLRPWFSDANLRRLARPDRTP